MKKALIIIEHRVCDGTLPSLEYWKEVFDESDIYIAWGGSAEDFKRINHSQSFFINDSRLRIKDLQRDKLSFTGIMQNCWEALKDSHYDMFCFFEGDAFPLRRSLPSKIEEIMKQTGADLIVSCLQRIDETNHPHFLFLQSDNDFLIYLREFSKRRNKTVILKTIGTPFIFKREVLKEFSKHNEIIPIHLEQYIATLVHHLGFKVVNLPNHDIFSLCHEQTVIGDSSSDALFLHPVKSIEGRWPWLD